MKKSSLIWIMCVALFLGACTNDVPDINEEYNPAKPVGFVIHDIDTTDAEGATRGTPIIDASQMTTMGVFASYTGTSDWSTSATFEKMFNRQLDYNSETGVWEYPKGQEVYWGATTLADRYSFFAYAPYGTGVYNESSNATGNGIVVNAPILTGVPSLRYTVPEKVENQPDLLIAVPKKNVRPTGSPISLDMKHALTCVGFQIAGNDEKVSGISIQGVSTTGTLVVDGETILWDELGTPTDTDFSASLNSALFDTDQSYYTTTENMTNLIAGDGYLMMIPQTLTDDAKVVVTYSDSSTKEIALGTQTWTAGQKVTYSITIPQLDGGQADILYFGADNRLSIGRWGSDVTSISNMVFTQFGSVIGFTGVDAWDNTTSILFNPTATAGYAYTSIPNYVQPTTAWAGSVAASPLVSDPAYHNGTNILAGRGDICKLVGLTSAQAQAMTAAELDAYKSGWRLPTLEENRVFVGTTPDDESDFTFPSDYYTWTANSGNASSPSTCRFPKNKYYQAGVNDVILPAAGYRDIDTGNAENSGNDGRYWSSTAYASNAGYRLRSISQQLTLNNPDTYDNGNSVRCISTGETPTPLLSVSPATYTFSAAGGTKSDFTVTIVNFTGTPTVTTIIDNADNTTAAWITNAEVSGSSSPYTLTVSASENSSTTARTATITLTAGTATATVTISQDPVVVGVLAPPGVIGYIKDTNTLTLRGSKEYSVNTDIANYAKTIHEDGLENETVYVAYFKFGSLVAISSDLSDSSAPYLESDDLIAGPTQYTGWDALKATPTWDGIPAYTSTDYGTTSMRNVSDASYHNETNFALGKGDPCMYYFGSGSWRLPTGAPYNGYGASDLQWKNADDLGSGLPAGGLSTRNGETGWFYPAAGYRDYDNNIGAVNNLGSGGSYWSSTAGSNTGGYILNFLNDYVAPSAGGNYAYGDAVRCVRE